MIEEGLESVSQWWKTESSFGHKTSDISFPKTFVGNNALFGYK
jgi:hypothetical protein